MCHFRCIFLHTRWETSLRFSSLTAFTFLWCGPLVLLLTGCGGGSTAQRPMGTVSGKVTLAGKALDAGRIIFAHVDGPAAVANIQKDGSYSVEATVGQTDVSIDHRGPPVEPPGGRAGMALPGKSLVPDKYADAKTSGLKLDVKAGKNPFDITMQ